MYNVNTSAQGAAAPPTNPGSELEIDRHHVRVTSRNSSLRVRVVRVLVPLCAALALVLSAQAASSETASESYRVLRVVDGDTIVLERIGTVRLIGIDTPETVDPRRPVQRFGKDASAFMRRLVDGKTVRVEYDWNRKDKYNRTLAYVYLLDGTFVNAEVIRQGYGFAYTRYPFKYLEQFRKLEREARAGNLGLWVPEAKAAPAPPARSSSGSQPASERVIVYVTRTGTKYHRADCPLLTRTAGTPMRLTEAITKHSPCAICKPPLPPR